jgi:hypothetical protein
MEVQKLNRRDPPASMDPGFRWRNGINSRSTFEQQLIANKPANDAVSKGEGLTIQIVNCVTGEDQ